MLYHDNIDKVQEKREWKYCIYAVSSQDLLHIQKTLRFVGWTRGTWRVGLGKCVLKPDLPLNNLHSVTNIVLSP